jgi:hypothetical protein
MDPVESATILALPATTGGEERDGEDVSAISDEPAADVA